MEKNYTEKIQALRKEITGDIIALMKKYGLDTLYASDIDDGSTPVIMSNPDIADLTYTLDKVEVKDDDLLISASNCENDATWEAKFIDIEILAGLAEWLNDNEDAIQELASDDNEEE